VPLDDDEDAAQHAAAARAKQHAAVEALAEFGVKITGLLSHGVEPGSPEAETRLGELMGMMRP
jgi:hypothetical protein